MYARVAETHNEMSPPGDRWGRRASVETYQVAVDLRAWPTDL